MADGVASVAEFRALSLGSGAADVADVADGVPVLPVTAARRAAAVAASGQASETPVGAFAGRPVFTVGDVAEIGLLAGCIAGCTPLLVAAFEAMLEPAFPMALFTQSRASFFPYLIVNGPIRQALGINCGANVFGPGARANATIGRAVRLGLARFAGVRMDASGPSALGTAYRFACVVGEDEENSPWPPLHGDFGFDRTQSTVMVLAASQPSHVEQHLSVEPALLVHAFADELVAPHCFHAVDVALPAGGFAPKAVVVLGGDHQGYFRDAGWDRARSKAALFEAAACDAAGVREAGYGLARPGWPVVRADGRISPLAGPEDVLLVSAGGGSSRSMVGHAAYAAIRPVRMVAAGAPALAAVQASGGASGGSATIDDYAAWVGRTMDGGATDGWPVIPPDAGEVAALVAASGRDGAETVGGAPWRTSPITVADVAINACMAGCTPAQMPLLMAMMRTLFSDAAGIGIGAHAASAGGYACWFVVHGPVARQLGLNAGAGLFGPGCAGAVALGRAVRLAMMNLAGIKPNVADRSGMGQAYKYGVVIGTDEASGWNGLGGHLAAGESGFTQSGFTLIWGFHSTLAVNEEATTAEQLLRSVAGTMGAQNYDSPSGRVPGEGAIPEGALMWVKALQQRSLVVVLSPGHRALLERAGWDVARAQAFVAGAISRSVGELRRSGFAASPFFDVEQPDTDRVRMLAGPDKVVFVAAGGPGGAALVFVATDFFAGVI